MANLSVHFMQMAIDLARQGMQEGSGGPFGCIIVKDGIVVGKGSNSVLATNDPTAHAEVMAIRDACTNLSSFQLSGCEIYTSCEPCPMCLGAIYWARPDKVYYSASRHDASDAGFDDSLIYDELQVPGPDKKIPLVQLSNQDAIIVFEEWKNDGSKMLY